MRIFTTRYSYDSFNKKKVLLSGPSTDELVKSGAIVTPYPHLISSRYFPLSSNGENVLTVLVPLIDGADLFQIFEELALTRPSTELAIRFASQCGRRDKRGIHVGKTIVFPHEPPFSEGVQPPAPSWLTLVWRQRKKLAELCLFMMQSRIHWPTNTFFVGIAK